VIENLNFENIKLLENDIHVWQIDLETQLQYLETYWSHLSNLEQSRVV
jgi:hypothetical protein